VTRGEVGVPGVGETWSVRTAATTTTDETRRRRRRTVRVGKTLS
jgi:hypothetical protein